MQTNTLVFIVFVVVMCCALASLIYFCAAEIALRRQPQRTAPPGSPGLDEHFADVQRVLSGRSPALYAAPTPLTNSAGIDDLRTLGATVLRAHIAGDSGTLRVLSATAPQVDLLNGMILMSEAVVVELAKDRGQTPNEVATALHREAIDRRLNQTVGHDGDAPDG